MGSQDYFNAYSFGWLLLTLGDHGAYIAHGNHSLYDGTQFCSPFCFTPIGDEPEI